MIGTYAPGIYERAYDGMSIDWGATPTLLNRRVVKPLLRADAQGWWFVDDWIVCLPKQPDTALADSRRMVKEMRRWTNWSARQLAELLGTSHTTVLAIEAGRSLDSSHSGDLHRRIAGAYDVISRIHVLASRNPSRTAQILEARSATQSSARDDLAAGNAAKAYITALDALHPPTEGLLVGIRPAEVGQATNPLHE
jgi:transcriptional regulator with XRE-family HTH domain